MKRAGKFIIFSNAFLLIILGLILLTPKPGGSCSPCEGSNMGLLLYIMTDPENIPFAGSCTLTEDSYCIDFDSYNASDKDGFCNLLGGTFTLNQTCSTENKIGVCESSEIGIKKVYYSNGNTPWSSSNAISDCESKIQGTWIEP